VGGNIIYHTTNLGASWDSIYQIIGDSNFNTYSIEFSSSLTGYLGGTRGKIYKTTDGGFSWRLQATEQFGNARYNSIFSLNDSIVWAAGAYNKILYTTNGGSFLVNNNEENTGITTDFKLYQNSPNPFNPETKIKYDVKTKSRIQINVIDVLGREIKTLIDKEQSLGFYEVVFDASDFQSGIYFYRLIADGKILYTRKMIVLK
jgi:hypothetical protein